MSSTSETGHAKNVSNFETLIIICTAFGVRYNPSKALIMLAALGIKFTAAGAELTKVRHLLPLYEAPSNARKILFKPFAKLVTNIVNAVKASDVTIEFIANVKTIARKLQGKRASPKIVDDPATPEDESKKSISASQMSFDMRIENFGKLIELLESNDGYDPNETELTVETLTALRAAMIAENTAAKTAYTPLDNARISRDVVLYDPETGLVKVATDVKSYVKSVFGATSDEFKQVSKLKFVVIENK